LTTKNNIYLFFVICFSRLTEVFNIRISSSVWASAVRASRIFWSWSSVNWWENPNLGHWDQF